MLVAHIVLSTVLALLFVVTGGGKLAGAASSHRIRDSLRLGRGTWRAIGVFELITVVALIVGIWLTPVALIGAALASVLLVGAIVARLRAGGPQRNPGVAADAVVLAIAAATLVLAAAR